LAYRALIFDLDGTLLRNDKQLSPYTVEILEKCREKGFFLMLATARPIRNVGEYLGKIRFDDMTVSNGGRLFIGEKTFDIPIEKKTAKAILEQLDQSLPLTFETGDVSYANLPFPEYETVFAEDLPSLAEKFPCVKIILHYKNAEQFAEIKKILPESCTATVTNDRLIQIMNREATKWLGIEKMLAAANILKEEAVYFGDHHDDVEALRKCGLGIAPGNAIDEAKAAADIVVLSNEEDGPARFLAERFL